ncbi:MarR family transcriptional regulator [Saccharopolyspora indica]|uniref:MarR family winged helix-turn-helix transcriptional regulator n=1 Tax=Saccharopolyspora indica TaxID=1229659 RepID=UPI0022EAF6DF|nr:MarR family transcriptional regulator [Saccharopolyspora indica]MDA3647650.1 MarR family transcriptional regulator [Saccharopolyspora indica]
MSGNSSGAADGSQEMAAVSRDFSAAQILFHSAVADVVGLSAGDYKCLDLALRAGRPLTAGQLAELSGLSTGTVTGVVDRLESAGLVLRVRDSEDRRRVLIEVTPEVETRFGGIFDSLHRAVQQLESEFTPDDLRVVHVYMKRSIEMFRQQILRLRDHAASGRRGTTEE